MFIKAYYSGFAEYGGTQQDLKKKKNEEAGYFLKTFTLCTCREMEAQYSVVSLGPKQGCH